MIPLDGDWLELRERELRAALEGGATWRAFVQESEQRLGRSWEEIREVFNLHDAEITRRDRAARL